MKRVLPIVQSILCAALALILIIGALKIYNNGAARRAADPSADIYTAENIAEAAWPALPVFVLLLASAAVCAATGARDEKADRPARVRVDADLSERARLLPSAGYLRLALLLLAAVCIIAGIFNGSLSDVFIKASKICTECIGLG